MFRYNLRSAENTGVSRIPSPPTSRDNVKQGSRDFSSEPSRKKSKTSVTSFFSLPPGNKGSGIYNYSLTVVKQTINWLQLDCILIVRYGSFIAR